MSDNDRTHDDADESAEPETETQPLTSLSSLLGGSFAGGQACDADGNCD